MFIKLFYTWIIIKSCLGCSWKTRKFLNFFQHNPYLSSRNFKGNRWPNATVPFVFYKGYSETQRKVFKKAMMGIEKSTCIKFVEKSNETQYLNINYDKVGIFSGVGFNARSGIQILNIHRLEVEDDNKTKALLMHELLHVLGFVHEHTRPDRDRYIQILWSNIKRPLIHNFFKSANINESHNKIICDPNNKSINLGYESTTFNTSYDYESIMHYNLNYGYSNGQPTMKIMKIKPSSMKVGQALQLSVLDILKVNIAYDCNKEE